MDDRTHQAQPSRAGALFVSWSLARLMWPVAGAQTASAGGAAQPAPATTAAADAFRAMIRPSTHEMVASACHRGEWP